MSDEHPEEDFTWRTVKLLDAPDEEGDARHNVGIQIGRSLDGEFFVIYEEWQYVGSEGVGTSGGLFLSRDEVREFAKALLEEAAKPTKPAVTCSECGTEYIPTGKKARLDRRRWCSPECKAEGMRVYRLQQSRDRRATIAFLRGAS